MAAQIYYGVDYWRQATYSDLLFLQDWCVQLSDGCWRTGESGLWTWFASLCGIEAERRKTPGSEALCWDLPTGFYASPERIAVAALDARALLALCQNAEQRSMVDRILFDLLSLLSVIVAEQQQPVELEPAQK